MSDSLELPTNMFIEKKNDVDAVENSNRLCKVGIADDDAPRVVPVDCRQVQDAKRYCRNGKARQIC